MSGLVPSPVSLPRLKLALKIGRIDIELPANPADVKRTEIAALDCGDGVAQPSSIMTSFPAAPIQFQGEAPFTCVPAEGANESIPRHARFLCCVPSYGTRSRILQPKSYKNVRPVRGLS